MNWTCWNSGWNCWIWLVDQHACGQHRDHRVYPVYTDLAPGTYAKQFVDTYIHSVQNRKRGTVKKKIHSFPWNFFWKADGQGSWKKILIAICLHFKNNRWKKIFIPHEPVCNEEEETDLSLQEKIICFFSHLKHARRMARKGLLWNCLNRSTVILLPSVSHKTNNGKWSKGKIEYPRIHTLRGFFTQLLSGLSANGTLCCAKEK